MNGHLDVMCPYFTSAKQIRHSEVLSMDVVDGGSEVVNAIWDNYLRINWMIYSSDIVDGPNPIGADAEPPSLYKTKVILPRLPTFGGF